MELTGLRDSNCVVTGAAQGIGLSIAQALAKAGARLMLLDMNAAGLGHAAEQLPKGGVVETRAVDICDRAAVDEAIAAAEDKLGPIRQLVNVAGIHRLSPLVDCSPEDLKATFDINVFGTLYVTQAVARRMIARKRGVIVTVSSNAAHVPRVKQGAYCASKAAVSHLMRVFALELGPLGIRCNTVAPGATETDMIKRMMAGMGFADQLIEGSLENYRVGTPLRKNAQVEDVAAATLFLLSDQASHITMHELVVDGGTSLGA
jgi:2,3-dihydro-2,3-dihydroxybenzoate dehydrogenase